MYQCWLENEFSNHTNPSYLYSTPPPPPAGIPANTYIPTHFASSFPSISPKLLWSI